MGASETMKSTKNLYMIQIAMSALCETKAQSI